MKNKILVLLLLIIMGNSAHAQIIFTIAGGDTSAYSGDGGPAIHAGINYPSGVAVDHAGNIYIADRDNNRIRKVDPSGIITTIAGTGRASYRGDHGPASLAGIYGPYGVAMDNSGNIYFTDNGNYRIRKIDVTGTITTIAGTGVRGYNGDDIPATSAQLTDPGGITIDAGNNIYFSEDNRIRKIDVLGIISTIAGTGIGGYSGDSLQATNAHLVLPVGIAVSASGDIYFTDCGYGRIRKIDTSGMLTTIAGTGIRGYTGDGGNAILAEITSPVGICIDANRNILFTDNYANCVRKIDPSGVISTIAGNDTAGFFGDGGPAINAKLSAPGCMVLDAQGNLYICDALNNRVRIISNTLSVPISEIDEKLSVYPNPTYGTFTIMASAPGTFELYNVLGQKLAAYAVTACQSEFQLPALLASGAYIGQFKPADGGSKKGSTTNISAIIKKGTMKIKTLTYILLALLTTAPAVSFAQYFQGLYDIGSVQNTGWNIFLQANSNYFIMEWNFDQNTDVFSTSNIQIDKNTNILTSVKFITINNATIGTANPGEAKMLLNGQYIVPIALQWPDLTTSYFYSAAGIIKYNADGDTVFSRKYTDTSVYFDRLLTCAVTEDSGYVLGGERGSNTPSYYKGLIIRTDSLGDTLWTKTYQKEDSQYTIINNIIPLGHGRMAVGAVSIYETTIYLPGYNYMHYTPWFMILDSMGNILKDTLYGSEYVMANTFTGVLYKDANGGYIHMGNYAILSGGDPNNAHSFPAYIAHLDTNFRITWITPFNFTAAYGHRQGMVMRQLHDSSYVVLGDAVTDYNPGYMGWAAKIDKHGSIVWCNTYLSDSSHPSYLRDVVEKPDGSLVFAGSSFNDTMPVWHQHFDLWLLGVDSNGCDNAFCAPVAVKSLPSLAGGAVSIYPNPTDGNFTVEVASSNSVPTPNDAVLEVYDIQGSKKAVYKINSGTNALSLPRYIGPGIYVCKYIPSGRNSLPVVMRLLYTP